MLVKLEHTLQIDLHIEILGKKLFRKSIIIEYNWRTTGPIIIKVT